MSIRIQIWTNVNRLLARMGENALMLLMATPVVVNLVTVVQPVTQVSIILEHLCMYLFNI